MEVAGTGDLRAHSVLPLALRVIGRPRDPALRGAVDALRAWRRAGGRRFDADARRRVRARGGDPDHGRLVAAAGARADASRCSASPRWTRCRRRRSSRTRPTTTAGTSAPPSRARGTATSARTCARVLGRKVKGRYFRKLCGARQAAPLPGRAARLAARGGSRSRRASSTARTRCAPRPARPATRRASTRSSFRPVGGATQPLIPWINRPTYQQVNEIQARVPR